MKRSILSVFVMCATMLTSQNIYAVQTTIGDDGTKVEVRNASKRGPDKDFKFDVEEITYDVMSGEEFPMPELLNPHKLTIETYPTPDNQEQALTIVRDEKTHEITSIKVNPSFIGDFTIYASAKKSSKYGPSTAECKVHFINSSIIERINFTSTNFESQKGNDNGWAATGSYADVWSCQCSDGWYTNTYNIYVTSFAECPLVSPEMTLAEGVNKIELIQSLVKIEDPDKQTKILVKEPSDTEWTQIFGMNTEHDGSSYEFFSSGALDIPAQFQGKTVQFALVYGTDGSYEPRWAIREVRLRSIHKADPEISFNVGDVEAIMGAEFTAPVLNNPNNVEVAYSSNKPEVATVDPVTGAVTLIGEGFTTITATSVETDKYESVAVNYVLTVKPATAADIIFEEKFGTSLGEFTIEGFNGDNNNIWEWRAGAAYADGYEKVKEAGTVYLVSPEITLSAAQNIVNYNYTFDNYGSKDLASQMHFCVREIGGEWIEVKVPHLEASLHIQESDDIILPSSLASKKVQIAFGYYAKDPWTASVWSIKDVAIRKGDAPVEKKDPQISFEKESYDYYFFGGEVFLSPVLNNPNKVEVTYSLDNSKVASVDTFGNVVVWGLGTTVITATSVETDEFKSATASYTLNVIDVPTGIDTIEGVSIKDAVIYDLQGNRVTYPTKGVYVVNGKKVIFK